MVIHSSNPFAVLSAHDEPIHFGVGHVSVQVKSTSSGPEEYCFYHGSNSLVYNQNDEDNDEREWLIVTRKSKKSNVVPKTEQEVVDSNNNEVSKLMDSTFVQKFEEVRHETACISTNTVQIEDICQACEEAPVEVLAKVKEFILGFIDTNNHTIEGSCEDCGENMMILNKFNNKITIEFKKVMEQLKHCSCKNKKVSIGIKDDTLIQNRLETLKANISDNKKEYTKGWTQPACTFTDNKLAKVQNEISKKDSCTFFYNDNLGTVDYRLIEYCLDPIKIAEIEGIRMYHHHKKMVMGTMKKKYIKQNTFEYKQHQKKVAYNLTFGTQNANVLGERRFDKKLNASMKAVEQVITTPTPKPNKKQRRKLRQQAVVHNATKVVSEKEIVSGCQCKYPCHNDSPCPCNDKFKCNERTKTPGIHYKFNNEAFEKYGMYLYDTAVTGTNTQYIRERHALFSQYSSHFDPNHEDYNYAYHQMYNNFTQSHLYQIKTYPFANPNSDDYCPYKCCNYLPDPLENDMDYNLVEKFEFDERNVLDCASLILRSSDNVDDQCETSCYVSDDVESNDEDFDENLDHEVNLVYQTVEDATDDDNDDTDDTNIVTPVVRDILSPITVLTEEDEQIDSEMEQLGETNNTVPGSDNDIHEVGSINSTTTSVINQTPGTFQRITRSMGTMAINNISRTINNSPILTPIRTRFGNITTIPAVFNNVANNMRNELSTNNDNSEPVLTAPVVTTVSYSENLVTVEDDTNSTKYEEKPNVTINTVPTLDTTNTTQSNENVTSTSPIPMVSSNSNDLNINSITTTVPTIKLFDMDPNDPKVADITKIINGYYFLGHGTEIPRDITMDQALEIVDRFGQPQKNVFRNISTEMQNDAYARNQLIQAQLVRAELESATSALEELQRRLVAQRVNQYQMPNTNDTTAATSAINTTDRTTVVASTTNTNNDNETHYRTPRSDNTRSSRSRRHHHDDSSSSSDSSVSYRFPEVESFEQFQSPRPSAVQTPANNMSFNGMHMYQPDDTNLLAISIDNGSFYSNRKRYIDSIKPIGSRNIDRDAKERQSVYKSLVKDSDSIKLFTPHSDLNKRGPLFVEFKVQLSSVFNKSIWTDRMINNLGIVDMNVTMNYFAHKACAQFIHSKLSRYTQSLVRDIAQDDPIAMLVYLKTLCQNTDPDYIMKFMQSLGAQKLAADETASNYISRMVVHFHTAMNLEQNIPTAMQVDYIINGICHDSRYEFPVNQLTFTRRNEQNMGLTQPHMCLDVTKILQIILQFERQKNIVQKKTKFNNNITDTTIKRSKSYARPKHYANEAHVANKHAHKRKFNMKCLVCGQSHKINDCPTATPAQKTEAFATLRAQREAREGTTTNFVSKHKSKSFKPKSKQSTHRHVQQSTSKQPSNLKAPSVQWPTNLIDGQANMVYFDDNGLAVDDDDAESVYSPTSPMYSPASWYCSSDSEMERMDVEELALFVAVIFESEVEVLRNNASLIGNRVDPLPKLWSKSHDYDSDATSNDASWYTSYRHHISHNEVTTPRYSNKAPPFNDFEFDIHIPDHPRLVKAPTETQCNDYLHDSNWTQRKSIQRVGKGTEFRVTPIERRRVIRRIQRHQRVAIRTILHPEDDEYESSSQSSDEQSIAPIQNPFDHLHFRADRNTEPFNVYQYMREVYHFNNDPHLYREHLRKRIRDNRDTSDMTRFEIMKQEKDMLSIDHCDTDSTRLHNQKGQQRQAEFDPVFDHVSLFNRHFQDYVPVQQNMQFDIPWIVECNFINEDHDTSDMSYCVPAYPDSDSDSSNICIENETYGYINAVDDVQTHHVGAPITPYPEHMMDNLRRKYSGIPPVHRGMLGEQPHNLWLLDSGTSAHVVPYLSDIDPGTFDPTFRGSLRVANGHRVSIIGRGNVTLTIKDYRSDTFVTLPLINVMVVPDLKRRLISTDELGNHHHEVLLHPHYVQFNLTDHSVSPPNTCIRMPRYYNFNKATKELTWPIISLRIARRDKNAIIASPLSLSRHPIFPAPINVSNHILVDTNQVENDVIEPEPVPKRHVPAQLLHHRLGHRSHETIKSGHKDNIWNDVKVVSDPESVCETCQVTKARMANRAQHPPDYPTQPGVMIYIDIIKNPFKHGLTAKSHFLYYLLIVDAYSHLPVLLGLDVITSQEVFRRIKVFQTMFRPTMDAPFHPDINAYNLRYIRTDAGTQFTSTDFFSLCIDAEINVSFAAPKHQEMNGLCERTWQSIRNVAFSFMNYARVGEEFGDLALEHAWKVLQVLPLKSLQKDEHLTTPYELFYRKKPSVRKFRVLFCPCVYKIHERIKRTSSKINHIYNAKNHPQRGVIGIFVGFPRSHAGFLIWEPRSKKLRYSLDVTFDEQFSSAGPRRHFAFRDALPVSVNETLPNMDAFQNTIPPDDHFGPPLFEYTEDVPSNGFLTSDNATPIFEVYDDTTTDVPSVEERETMVHVEEVDNEDEGGDVVKLHHNSHDSEYESEPLSIYDSSPEPVPLFPEQTVLPTESSPDQLNDEYVDPLRILRPGKRTIRRKMIFDPSNISNFAEQILDGIESTPFANVTKKAIQQQQDATIEGNDPMDYLPEPQSLKAVRKLPSHIREQWLKSFRKEITMHLTMKTWRKATEYKGEKLVPVTVIYKTKLKSDGTIDKLKVRVAMRGDLDKGAEGEDNGAPLATFRLLKVFAAGAARKRRRIYQSDFVGAYLQAFMDRVVYIILPKEWAEFFPDLAEWFGVPLLLLKSAYGISSAGRLWAEALFAWYIEFGFKQSTVDSSLFKYNDGKEWIVLLSYCDDSAYYCSSDTIRQHFEAEMCKRFDCKLLGQLHWFLQARITQNEKFDVTLDQSRYAASMVKRFFPTLKTDTIAPTDKDSAKYAAPLPLNFVFTKDDCSATYFEVKKLEDEFGVEFPVVIGCLLWILNTFPRLQFAIRKLAKYMRLPGRNHFSAMMHLLNHVRCHHTNGLTYYSDPCDAPVSRLLFEQNINPVQYTFYTFADSSWQDCPDTGRSTGGYHIFYQGGIVDSAMTFPIPVALSSAEAEYNNACAASVAINAMAMLINDFNDLDPDTPLNVPLLLDNQACIAMGESFKDTKHTRHILRRYHYVRWMVEENRICLMWVPTDVQLADPATKCLAMTDITYILFRQIAETPVIL